MLTFILIIILFSLLIRYLMPYVLPRLLMFWVKRQQKANQAWQQKPPDPEGSVNVKYPPPGQKKVKSRFPDAEEVDFEEIEK
ncbi:MAG: hypothetical protein IH597_16505 [Bacteroidales bacterium]|nr:hypothetical protein [Bacteroidales bacterium]